jgi:Tol biopolymer transport system component
MEDIVIFRIDPVTQAATQLPTPNNTYDVAFSPDGQRMIYSVTYGLGYGSQTYIANADGSNPRLILNEPQSIIAFARWSPDGDHIAYLRWADTNIPFTVGELWLADGNGGSPVLLAPADAGHGYEPAWSPDSTRIAFVSRENPGDLWADQAAERLMSNIYIVTINGGAVTNLTNFTNALTENPSWSPDSSMVAFNTNAGGTMDIWVANMQSRQLQQVTQGAEARYPIWSVVNETSTIPTP